MGRMHAWFDISAGVAGDMLLGSLLDAGADAAAVQEAIDRVAPGSVRLETEEVVRGGQRATKARVRVLVDDPPHRTWASIRTTLTEADLDERTRAWALASFSRLADAEARVHGTSPEDVHFHEVGALDSIADVVGTCEALRTLGVTSVSASPLRLGDGRVRAAHGDIPVPVPAVAELVLGWRVLASPAQDAPVHHHHEGEPHDHHHDHDGPHHHDETHHHHHDHDHDTPASVTTPGAVGELATPTGVAVVRALAERCEPLPGMTVQRVGVGAGGKDFAGWPNVVRVLVGEASDAADRPATELAELRANVDDLDPRLWPGVLEAVFAAGAADAWLAPIHMKKGRPAFTLHALAAADVRDAVVDAMLAHTTTLGVRETVVTRTVAERGWVDVEVEGRPLPVKVGHRAGRVLHASAEFDALAGLASELGRPQAEVAQRAAAAIVAAGLVPGSPVPPNARGSRD